jgi:hypothetical protein
MSIAKSNLMLDLETLGTKPGCVILSIAAVPFNMPYDVDPFYRKISPESAADVGLITDPATMEWWKKQGDAARDEAFSGTEDVKLVLTDFAQYISDMPSAPKIWGNGSDFDNPILAAAYHICEMRVPWSFRDNRCFRTLKSEFDFLPYTPPQIAHNALQDAMAQATQMNKIYHWLYSKGALPNVQ